MFVRCFLVSKSLLNSFHPGSQGIIPTSCCRCMVRHGLHHRVALHTVAGSLAHLDEGQPVTFPTMANDLVDVPRSSWVPTAHFSGKNKKHSTKKAIEKMMFRSNVFKFKSFNGEEKTGTVDHVFPPGAETRILWRLK